jgi:hypothetical protein
MDDSVAGQKINVAKCFLRPHRKLVSFSIDFPKSIWLLDCLFSFCDDLGLSFVVQCLFGIQSPRIQRVTYWGGTSATAENRRLMIV